MDSALTEPLSMAAHKIPDEHVFSMTLRPTILSSVAIGDMAPICAGRCY